MNNHSPKGVIFKVEIISHSETISGSEITSVSETISANKDLKKENINKNIKSKILKLMQEIIQIRVGDPKYTTADLFNDIERACIRDKIPYTRQMIIDVVENR